MEVLAEIIALLTSESHCSAYISALSALYNKESLRPRIYSAIEEQDALASLTPDDIWDRLNLLSQYWVSCAVSLYRKDVFMGDLIGAVPPCCQFGWYIMQANAIKT